MRRLHRWIAPLFAGLMIYLALSGLTIEAVDLVTLLAPAPWNAANLDGINAGAAFLRPGYVPSPPGVPVAGAAVALLPVDGLPAMADRVYAAGSAAAPGRFIVGLTLRMGDGRPQGVVRLAPPAGALVFDAQSGRALPADPPPPRAPNLHDIVKGLHSGNFAAAPGGWVSFFCGTALLTATCTGLTLYVQMLTRRRRAGRRGMFWR